MNKIVITKAPEAIITAGRKNGRPRGYIDNYRPQASTRILLEQVKEVLEEYRQYWPLTCRQIFYRLVGRYGFDKNESAYGKLCHHIANARRGRWVEWDAIRDDGVTSYSMEHYEDRDHFLRLMKARADNYTRNKLASQDVHIEVWCEAAGMLAQLSDVAAPYSVRCYSSGGFDSLTAKKSLADRIIEKEKHTVILHLGDYDPSGESIFASVADDVSAFVEADRPHGMVSVEFKRVSLTREQVELYDLPTAPAKSTDTRSKGWDGGTCQLEALPPDVIAKMVEEAILLEIDYSTFQNDEDVEREERNHLRQLLLAPPQVGEVSA